MGRGKRRGRCREHYFTWGSGVYKKELLCISKKLGVPGSLELDVYTAIQVLLKDKEKGDIQLKAIAELYEGRTTGGIITRISEAIERLALSKYRFVGCLEEGNFDSVEIPLIVRKRKGKGRGLYYEIEQPQEVMSLYTENKYQMVSFCTYRTLAQGLTRLMLEF
jgi:hypothetical protein